MGCHGFPTMLTTVKSLHSIREHSNSHFRIDLFEHFSAIWNASFSENAYEFGHLRIFYWTINCNEDFNAKLFIKDMSEQKTELDITCKNHCTKKKYNIPVKKVSKIHGFLQQKNIRRILNDTNYTRQELFIMYT